MLRNRFLLFVVGLGVSLPLSAEVQNAESSFWKNRWENIKSPITTDAKWSIYGGTAVLLVLLINEDQWVDETAEEVTENKIMSPFWSNAADTYGQLVPNALYFAGMGAYGYYADNAIAKKRAWMMFEASLYSGITAQLLKVTVREPRPPPTKTNDSFPSGHTTSAFTFASLVQAEHGWGWGSAAYAGALLTAFQRQHNNKHYLHDVVAGAAIGSAFGYGISFANNKNPDLTVLAFPDADGARAQVSLDF